MSRFFFVFFLSFGALTLAAAPAAGQSLERDYQTAPIFSMSVTVKPLSAPSLMTPLYSSFATLTAGDGYLTWQAIHRGAVEENPIAQPVVDNPVGLTTFKIVTGAATLFAVERLRRDHPKAAMWMMLAINGGMTWVVLHNAQVAGAVR
jgi:Domain of unknown function (DUF5658)